MKMFEKLKWMPVTGWFCLIFGVNVQAAALSTPYDFKTCVETALSQNPEMVVSQQRLAQAQYALKEANASRFPQVTASMTASQSNSALNVFGMKLNQRQASFADFGFSQFDSINPNILKVQPDDLNNPGGHTDINTRLEILIPVWNGGKISGYQSQAKAMIQAAQKGEQAVQQFLTFNVYQAYEGVHTARAFVSVAEQAVKAAQAYVDTTANLVEQGVVVRSELLSANVHLSQAKTSFEQAKMQEQLALDSLKMLMATPDDEEIRVGDRMSVTLPNASLESLLVMGMNTNPRLNAKREAVRSSRAEVDIHKADQRPSFNIMARGDFNDAGFEFDSQSYTVAGVLSWKITDFGLTTNRLNRAAAVTAEKQAAVRSQENQTRHAILKAWRTLQVVERQVYSHQLAVEQAEEAQRLILKRYKGGIATMTEVLASQAQLDKARAELVQSLYEQNIQKAKLRLETGSMRLDQL